MTLKGGVVIIEEYKYRKLLESILVTVPSATYEKLERGLRALAHYYEDFADEDPFRLGASLAARSLADDLFDFLQQDGATQKARTASLTAHDKAQSVAALKFLSSMWRAALEAEDEVGRLLDEAPGPDAKAAVYRTWGAAKFAREQRRAAREAEEAARRGGGAARGVREEDEGAAEESGGAAASEKLAAAREVLGLTERELQEALLAEKRLAARQEEAAWVAAAGGGGGAARAEETVTPNPFDALQLGEVSPAELASASGAEEESFEDRAAAAMGGQRKTKESKAVQAARAQLAGLPSAASIPRAVDPSPEEEKRRAFIDDYPPGIQDFQRSLARELLGRKGSSSLEEATSMFVDYRETDAVSAAALTEDAPATRKEYLKRKKAFDLLQKAGKLSELSTEDLERLFRLSIYEVAFHRSEAARRAVLPIEKEIDALARTFTKAEQKLTLLEANVATTQSEVQAATDELFAITEFVRISLSSVQGLYAAVEVVSLGYVDQKHGLDPVLYEPLLKKIKALDMRRGALQPRVIATMQAVATNAERATGVDLTVFKELGAALAEGFPVHTEQSAELVKGAGDITAKLLVLEADIKRVVRVPLRSGKTFPDTTKRIYAWLYDIQRNWESINWPEGLVRVGTNPDTATMRVHERFLATVASTFLGGDMGGVLPRIVDKWLTSNRDAAFVAEFYPK